MLLLNANGILEKYLGQHADWYRYGNQNHVLCTSSELSELANGIKQLPGFQRAYIFCLRYTILDISDGWTQSSGSG